MKAPTWFNQLFKRDNDVEKIDLATLLTPAVIKEKLLSSPAAQAALANEMKTEVNSQIDAAIAATFAAPAQSE